MLTYHAVAADEFDPESSEYVPVDYPNDGFIHTTAPPHRVAEAANRHRRGDPRPFLLLTIDLDRVSAPWRYDASGDDYPHIYGPLNRDAIVDVQPFPRSPDGQFLPI